MKVQYSSTASSHIYPKRLLPCPISRMVEKRDIDRDMGSIDSVQAVYEPWVEATVPHEAVRRSGSSQGQANSSGDDRMLL